MHSNTLIILDWDDTLFPTTWVTKNNINLSDQTSKFQNQLMFSELDNVLYNFLSKCLEYGSVTIITNASYGWIVLTMTMLPNTSKLINKYIRILSARDMFQKITHINKWKLHAFEHEAINYFQNKFDVHNIISVGDAEYEYNALINFHDWEKIMPKQRLLKTIRFVSIPSFYVLIDQLNVLTACIDKVCKKKQHIDLHFKSIQ